MQAKDIMTIGPLVAAGAELAVADVAQLMFVHDVGSVPVCDDEGRLLGIVTDRDLAVRVLGERLSANTPVAAVMTPHVHVCRETDDIQAVEATMTREKIRRIPVVDDDDCLCGFIALADLARHPGADLNESEMAHVVEGISRAE